MSFELIGLNCQTIDKDGTVVDRAKAPFTVAYTALSDSSIKTEFIYYNTVDPLNNDLTEVFFPIDIMSHIEFLLSGSATDEGGPASASFFTSIVQYNAKYIKEQVDLSLLTVAYLDGLVSSNIGDPTNFFSRSSADTGFDTAEQTYSASVKTKRAIAPRSNGVINFDVYAIRITFDIANVIKALNVLANFDTSLEFKNMGSYLPGAPASTGICTNSDAQVSDPNLVGIVY